jgi:hypothetical protein
MCSLQQTWVDDLFYKALAYVLDLDMVVDTTMVGTVQSGLSQVCSVLTTSTT